MQSQHFATEKTEADGDTQNVAVCIFSTIRYRTHVVSFSPELRWPVGAMCMYPEEAGVCRFISKAQPHAAQPPPHNAQG